MSYLRENNLNILRNILLEEFPNFREFYSYIVDLYAGQTFIELYDRLNMIDARIIINDSLLEQDPLSGEPNFKEVILKMQDSINLLNSKKVE